MRKFSKKPIIMLMVAVIAAGVHTAVSAESRSSASYRIPSEVMGSGGGARSSTSYAAIEVLSGLNLGLGTSTSYFLREGFIPPAFPVLAMLVTAVTPSSGYNTGSVDITSLTGSGFLSGATVTLSRTGESDIVATDVVVMSPTEITCTFDLTGARTGLWDVVVANPGGPIDILPNAFNILTWATLSRAVNSPNPFDPRTESTTIVYQLAQDADVTLAIISTTANLLWKRNYAAGSNGGRAGDNSIVWDGIDDFRVRASNGVYLLRVMERSTGKILARGKIAVIIR